jgi:hypothetical protein
MKQISILLILLCFSCGQIKHSKPLSFIGISNTLDTSKIRLDGYYNKLDTTIITYECEAKGKKYNEIYSSIDLIVLDNKKIFTSMQEEQLVRNHSLVTIIME